MRPLNTQVMQILKDNYPCTYAAHEIVSRTGLSFSAVRDTLNRARDMGLAGRDLDVGLNGHTLYRWYWQGGE